MKIKKTFQGVIPENKILNAESTSQTDTYSCDYINNTSIVVSPTEPTGKNRKKVWMQKGKNLFYGKLTGGTFSNGVPNSEMSTIRVRNDEYISTNINTEYTINAKYSKILQTSIMLYDANKNLIKETGWNNVPYNFTTTNTTRYIMFVLRDSSSEIITTSDIIDVQIEQGPTATEYEAYIEPKIYIKNSNDVYEEFIKKNKEGIVDYNDYIEFNDKITNINNCITYKKDNILFLTFDLKGNFTKGETTIGTLKKKIKQSSFGSGRIKPNDNEVSPATYTAISKGAVRIHTTVAGILTAGNIIMVLDE